MIRFLTDEDFNRHVYSGIRRRLPDVDIVRVQDVGLRAASDPIVLEFAASENRIVLSHDFRTMETYAVARLTAGKPMPGLFLINQYFPVGRAIEEIIVIAECSEPSEWIDRIIRLPL